MYLIFVAIMMEKDNEFLIPLLKLNNAADFVFIGNLL